jgi:hypothetical protein
VRDKGERERERRERERGGQWKRGDIEREWV